MLKTDPELVAILRMATPDAVAELNCTRQNISLLRQRYSVTEWAHRPSKAPICKWCGKKCVAPRIKFCSLECRSKDAMSRWPRCTVCDKQFRRYGKKQGAYCSHECFGKAWSADPRRKVGVKV